MAYNPSVPLTRLYEATSKNGNIYLRGRLGFANIVILKTDKLSDSGQPIWNVLVSEPDQKAEDRQDRSERSSPRRPDPEAQASAARGFQRDELDDPIPF